MGKIEKHSELLLQGEKKTLLDEKSEANATDMIELKGTNVNAAFEQIARTVDCLFADSELKNCVMLRETLDAYIVSPERQKIPNIPSFEERELVKKLARGTKNRPKNIFGLLHFVKVLKNQKK